MTLEVRLTTIHYGRNASGSEKSETRTEILVGIMDEEDEFEDVDVHWNIT
jgi:hypothetical protein